MQDIFKKRKWTMISLVLGFSIIYTIASVSTGFKLGDSISAIFNSFFWLFKNFAPSAHSFKYFPLILRKLLSTILLSITATTSATVFSIIFAVIGSKSTGLNVFTKSMGRIIASIFRNVPVVVWAMIFLLSFKQSEFTGYLALTLTTFGYLTRAFMETIDEVAGSIIEALKATGATYIQIIMQGVIPSVLGQLISWVLFLIEHNIRDATLIGMLTGTGIGFVFDIFYKKFQYDVTGLVTLSIIVVVILLEFTSNKIRRLIH